MGGVGDSLLGSPGFGHLDWYTRRLQQLFSPRFSYAALCPQMPTDAPPAPPVSSGLHFPPRGGGVPWARPSLRGPSRVVCFSVNSAFY